MPDEINTLQQAENYLNSLIIPITQYHHFKLDRISKLLQLIGNPHRQFPTIHITGTSGKGSTSLMTAAILKEAGYKVGLYQSPHLQKITERIQFNLSLIPDDDFAQILKTIKPYIDQVNAEEKNGFLTYFEILTAMAFYYFANKKVDVAVIEVGLGGTYDATNVIHSQVSVLTNVGLDHTEILGKTVQKIAKDKTGIFKSNAVAITGASQPSVIRIAQNKADSLHIPLFVQHRDFWAENIRSDRHSQTYTLDYITPELRIADIKLSLKGRYQIQNTLLAITAVKNFPDIRVTNSHIKNALQKLQFPGRMEVITHQGKTLILDGAHNVMKIRQMVQSVKKMYPREKVAVILAIKYDKNAQRMIKILDSIASEIFLTDVRTISDLGANVMTPKEKISEFVKAIDPDIKITMTEAPDDLFSDLQSLTKNNIILITGSLYLVRRVRAILGLPFQVQSDSSASSKLIELKQKVRKEVLERRKNFKSESQKNASEVIKQNLQNSSAYQKSRNLCLYVSMAEEVNTKTIIEEELQKKEKRIILPRIVGDDLILHQILGWSDLEKGPLGILQPKKDCLQIDPNTINLYVVPLVAFDQNLHRLGWGKGYYDRLLRHSKAIKIGVAFEIQKVDNVPTSEFDIDLDSIVTEKQWYQK